MIKLLSRTAFSCIISFWKIMNFHIMNTFWVVFSSFCLALIKISGQKITKFWGWFSKLKKWQDFANNHYKIIDSMRFSMSKTLWFIISNLLNHFNLIVGLDFRGFRNLARNSHMKKVINSGAKHSPSTLPLGRPSGNLRCFRGWCFFALHERFFAILDDQSVESRSFLLQ